MPTTAPQFTGHTALSSLETDGCTADEALTFFDTLPPVAAEEVTGSWRGAEIATGSPMDGLPDLAGWHGVRIHSADSAHPLIMTGTHGRYSLNPALLPLRTPDGLVPLLRRQLTRSLTLRLLPMLATEQSTAVVRHIEYRGVVSAAVVYDALPVTEYLRAVDRNTLVGALDAAELPTPWFFTLYRQGADGRDLPPVSS